MWDAPIIRSVFRFLMVLGIVMGTQAVWADAAETLSQSSLNVLRANAEKGDAKAQFEYGKALADTASKAEAATWLEKAANQGFAEAWFWLGYAGLGKEKPVFYYKKAAESGFEKAFSHLEDELLFRASASADTNEAKKYADLARHMNLKIDSGWGNAFATIDRCYEAGAPEIPVADLPTAEEKGKFLSAKTDCATFLDESMEKRRWKEYRKCRLSEEAVNNNAVAEVYANGWGVDRNAKLALALVCHGSEVPAELIGMVDMLYTTKDQKRIEREFRFCDLVTSGMNSGMCAFEHAQSLSRKREQEFSLLTSHWTVRQKKEFGLLRKTAEAYFLEHANSELDLSGSMRGAISIDEQIAFAEDFLKLVTECERNHLPKDAHFKKADLELNSLYTKVMMRKSDDYAGGIAYEGIKATQRKWIAYRDAWVAFANARYPRTAPEIWKTKLTRDRIVILEKLLPDAVQEP
jgi:uncharacterized protein YecT (DUF1311 family)